MARPSRYSPEVREWERGDGAQHRSPWAAIGLTASKMGYTRGATQPNQLWVSDFSVPQQAA